MTYITAILCDKYQCVIGQRVRAALHLHCKRLLRVTTDKVKIPFDNQPAFCDCRRSWPMPVKRKQIINLMMNQITSARYDRANMLLSRPGLDTFSRELFSATVAAEKERMSLTPRERTIMARAEKLKKILRLGAPKTLPPSAGVRLTIHLTASEMRALKLAARQCGQTIDRYARTAVHGNAESDIDSLAVGSMDPLS